MGNRTTAAPLFAEWANMIPSQNGYMLQMAFSNANIRSRGKMSRSTECGCHQRNSSRARPLLNLNWNLNWNWYWNHRSTVSNWKRTVTSCRCWPCQGQNYASCFVNTRKKLQRTRGGQTIENNKNYKDKTKENVLQLSSSLASLQSGTLSQRKCRPTHDPSSHWNSSERQSLVDEPAPPPADSSTGGADVGAASVGITFEGVVHSVTTRVTTSNFRWVLILVLHIF